MNQNDIANLRLISQQIVGTNFKSAKEIVSWMGAIQAQDFNMAKWATGIRLKKSTEQNIDAAINSGEIIRTHVLRPTWHFVAADDIYWMLDLTGPKIKSSLKGRHKQLELTDSILKKSNKIIQKVLAENQFATRKELVSYLNKAKIKTNENRASHIFLNAELNKIICSGQLKGKEITYALLNERVIKPKPIDRQESLGMLAKKYFQSHSPATLQDFVWWSGLNISDAKTGLEIIKNDLVSEQINEQEYWYHNSFSIPKKIKDSVFLLPAFDEFLISYKDRNASVVTEYESKVFSKNGIFWPAIIINGKVMGTWKREIKKDKLFISTHFFKSNKKDLQIASLKKEVGKLGYFLNKKSELLANY